MATPQTPSTPSSSEETVSPARSEASDEDSTEKEESKQIDWVYVPPLYSPTPPEEDDDNSVGCPHTNESVWNTFLCKETRRDWYRAFCRQCNFWREDCIADPENTPYCRQHWWSWWNDAIKPNNAQEEIYVW